jgi:hypothetical protein
LDLAALKDSKDPVKQADAQLQKQLKGNEAAFSKAVKPLETLLSTINGKLAEPME